MYASKGIDISPNGQSENSNVYGDGILSQGFSSVSPSALLMNKPSVDLSYSRMTVLFQQALSVY